MANVDKLTQMMAGGQGKPQKKAKPKKAKGLKAMMGGQKPQASKSAKPKQGGDSAPSKDKLRTMIMQILKEEFDIDAEELKAEGDEGELNRNKGDESDGVEPEPSKDLAEAMNGNTNTDEAQDGEGGKGYDGKGGDYSGKGGPGNMNRSSQPKTGKASYPQTRAPETLDQMPQRKVLPNSMAGDNTEPLPDTMTSRQAPMSNMSRPGDSGNQMMDRMRDEILQGALSTALTPATGGANKILELLLQNRR